METKRTATVATFIAHGFDEGVVVQMFEVAPGPDGEVEPPFNPDGYLAKLALTLDDLHMSSDDLGVFIPQKEIVEAGRRLGFTVTSRWHIVDELEDGRGGAWATVERTPQNAPV